MTPPAGSSWTAATNPRGQAHPGGATRPGLAPHVSSANLAYAARDAVRDVLAASWQRLPQTLPAGEAASVSLAEVV